MAEWVTPYPSCKQVSAYSPQVTHWPTTAHFPWLVPPFDFIVLWVHRAPTECWRNPGLFIDEEKIRLGAVRQVSIIAEPTGRRSKTPTQVHLTPKPWLSTTLWLAYPCVPICALVCICLSLCCLHMNVQNYTTLLLMLFPAINRMAVNVLWLPITASETLGVIHQCSVLTVKVSALLN